MVVKSLAAYEWAGNPAPRLHPTPQGMLNAVGLRVLASRAGSPTTCLGYSTAASVVASIWGRTVDDYRRAADLLAGAPNGVIAVEVNLSCPNLEGRGGIFAHDCEMSAAVIAATDGCGRPRWAKLSPNTDRIVESRQPCAAGAEAVTLVNTMLGMVVDPSARRPALGAGGGGLSGRAIHPIAVRAVHDVARPTPTCRSSASAGWRTDGMQPS